MICLPIADKLNSLTLAIDGVMQIRDNKSPDLIKETLVSYLPEKQRDDLVREAA